MTTNETNDLYFEDEPLRLPVKIAGRFYVLEEARGSATVQYRNAALACTQFTPGGATVVRNMADVEPLLVSLCLFNALDEPIKAEGRDPEPCEFEDGVVRYKGSPVKKTIVMSWPSKIQKKLFEKIKSISDIGEGGDERDEFSKAFETEDAPVSLDVLRDWISGLDSEEFGALQKWIKPTPKELAKNAQDGMTDSIA